MDVQAQVAARRAALAEQERQAQAAQAQLDAARKVAEQHQREAAIDAIAEGLSGSGVAVTRNGEELALTVPDLPQLDVEGLRRSQVESLLRREARKLWTPGDNWFVISCIVGGVCLLHLAGLGLILLGIGVWRRAIINKRYRADVRERYPQLFGPSPESAA